MWEVYAQSNRERFVSSALHVSREGGVLSQCPSAGVQTRTGSSLDQAFLLAYRTTSCCHGTSLCPVGWPVPGESSIHHPTRSSSHHIHCLTQLAAGYGYLSKFWEKKISWKDHKRLVCTALKFIKKLLKAMVFAHCWRESKQIIFPLEKEGKYVMLCYKDN